MEQNGTTVINNKLDFKPMCPSCGCAIAIERGICGHYAKCENCNSEYSASPFSKPGDERAWLEKFHFVWDGEKLVKPQQVETPFEFPAKKADVPPNPPPQTDAKVLMEIAHSSEILKKAYEMVSEAYKLVSSDKVAHKYINFHSEIRWLNFVWDILMSQYNKDNPDSKDVYHLRAFDYYGIHPGMYVTDGCVDGSGS